MKKNAKRIKLCSFIGLCVAAAVVAICTTNSSLIGLNANEDYGTWYHYGAVESTCTKNGIREYWTNCHGTTLIEKPEGPCVDKSLTEDQIKAIIANPEDQRVTEKKKHTFSTSTIDVPISYIRGTCTTCSQALTVLVDDEDIAAAGQEWGLCKVFGGNGTAMNKSSFSEFPEYADLVGCKSGWQNNVAGNVVNVLLPKVNFALFKKVSFIFHTNSNTASNVLFGFGLTDTGEDLFAYESRGVRDQYELACEFNEGKLNVSLTCNGVTKTGVIDNDDVEIGNNSVSIYVKMGAWRILALDSIVVTPAPVSKIVIDDFSKSQYGAEATTGASLVIGQDVGKPGGFDNCLTWKSSNDGSALETTIGLPKIAYTDYDSVVFNIFFNGGDSWNEIVGVDAKTSSKISTKAGHTLTVYKDSQGNYKAKLVLVYGNSNPTFEITVDDADVLAGTKCLYGVYYKASGPYRNICVTSIELNKAI